MVAYFYGTHTPLHLIFSAMHAHEVGADQDSFLLYHEGALPDSGADHVFSEVRTLPGYSGYRSGRHISAQNAEIIAKNILALGDYAEVVFVCSDLKWLTNNQVYISTRHKPNVSFQLVPDGLGSYLPRSDLRRTHLAAVTKWFLGKINYGPAHAPLWHNYLGYSSKYVDAAFGPNASLLLGRVNKVELAPTQKELDALPSNDLLFLGAPLPTGEKDFDKVQGIFNMAIEHARSVTNGNLSYKPHHFEHPEFKRYFIERGFRLEERRDPAEVLIERGQYGHLMGYFSSSLALAKYFNPSVSVHCTQYEQVASMFLNRDDMARLRVVLSAFGAIE